MHVSLLLSDCYAYREREVEGVVDMLGYYICIVDDHLGWYNVPQVSSEVPADKVFQHDGFCPLLKNIELLDLIINPINIRPNH